MSGVWVFKNGIIRLLDYNSSHEGLGQRRRKVLVHIATNQVVTSYEMLERMLLPLGWERYYDDPDLFQFHKSFHTMHLISLPKDFNKLKSIHLYDIVVKSRPNVFEVRDLV
uniref:flowering-promoting factor 1-like protein 3 n=1 Tax=Erigeron canadensis TaxID=72917 RepID=UPI001CB94862|nr:flowering-promoting factor 1-like protein 3 [Erigeron canadensis]